MKDTVQQCKETTETRRLLMMCHDGHSEDEDEDDDDNKSEDPLGFTSTSKLIQSLCDN